MDAAKTTTPASDLVAAATTGVRLALRRDMRNCETFEDVRSDGPDTIVAQIDGREYRITVTEVRSMPTAPECPRMAGKGRVEVGGIGDGSEPWAAV